MVITLVILLGGHYERIEHLATLKVCLFTMLTLLCAALLVSQPAFSIADIVDGLKFQMPGTGIATAIAVFGITGVGASRPLHVSVLVHGKRIRALDGHAGQQRSVAPAGVGWIPRDERDILASMVIYSTATIAFYFLGAGVLHARAFAHRQ